MVSPNFHLAIVYRLSLCPSTIELCASWAPITNLDHLAKQLHSLQDDDRSRSQSLRFAQTILTQAAGGLLPCHKRSLRPRLCFCKGLGLKGTARGMRRLISTVVHSLKLRDSPQTQPLKHRSTSQQSSSSPPSLLAPSATSSPSFSHHPLSLSPPLHRSAATPPPRATPDPSTHYVSESSYEREREKIFLYKSLLMNSIDLPASARRLI